MKNIATNELRPFPHFTSKMTYGQIKCCTACHIPQQRAEP